VLEEINKNEEKKKRPQEREKKKNKKKKKNVWERSYQRNGGLQQDHLPPGESRRLNQ